ncbi:MULTISPECIES: extracellular solute-binding protein [Streptomyces]|uniref:Tat pathway signal sequence domain protein n=2 Tax=Streptomyces TaxID=1883 RepID=A0A100Y951_9ACTN|nr:MULTISPECIES: extracellular solute-binding protein [Streptomyces]KUH39960.1 Tat pathway signal sequence domain protein [Streptomyces kanasensis]UUS29643.1 extracellular solute-binding protein [Streptomyces changanensis]
MTPNSPSARTSGPSRRGFLASTAVAAAAVAGGVPLLSACGGGSRGERKDGATSGKDAEKLLPTYVAQDVVRPDIPARNGSAAGFTSALAAARLKTSVPEKLGKGGTVRIMAPLWGSPPKSDNPYYRAMDAAIGVRTRWQNQDGNTYDEKLGAVLASSDIPDVVVVPGWNLTGKIPSAVNAKFADLGPYLSGDKVKDYPNLAAVPTDAWQRSIFGGALRGIPMPASYVTNIAPYYRQDVFEARGYRVPKSADEFLAWAKEATSAKAKVWACDDMKWTAFNVFGVLPGSDKALWWNLVDGKLVNRIETEEYLEALEWVRKLYAANVVHPDARAQNQGDAGNRFTAGQVLVYNNDLSHWYVKSIEQAAQNPKFRMAAMDVFGHDGSAPKLYAQQPANIFTFVSAKASEAVVRDFLAVANFCAAPYGTKERLLTDYGVEGTHHTLRDGMPVKNDTGHLQVTGAFDLVGDPAPYNAHPDRPDLVKAQVEWQQRMGAFTTKTSFYGLTVTEPGRWTNLADDFEQLEDDVVRGRKKIGDVQQAVSEWKSKGGDKLRDWYRKLLDDTGSAS